MKRQQRQEEFNLQIRARGGEPLDLDSLDLQSFEYSLLKSFRDNVHGTVEHIRKNFKYSPRFWPIFFDFIDDARINAVAFTGSGGMYLGVNTGTVYLIVDFFYRVLSHPRIYCDGTDAPGEVRSIYHDQPITSDYAQLVRNRPSGTLQKLKPKTGIRAGHAESAIISTYRFLILHEIGHLLKGHTAYRASKGWPINSELNEGGEVDDLMRLTLQALELDADAFAMQYSLRVFLANKVPGRPHANTLFELFLSALCLYWLLFDPRNPLDSSSRHPSPALRAIQLTESARTYIKLAGPSYLIEHADPLAMHAWSDAAAFLVMFNPDIHGKVNSDLKAIQSPEMHELRMRLTIRLVELQKELIPFVPRPN